MLSDVIMTSPIVVGEDGMGAMPSAGFEFGIDPNEDPELALVSSLIGQHYIIANLKKTLFLMLLNIIRFTVASSS